MTFSILDLVSSYNVRFWCILYGRKAWTENYNFHVERFCKNRPETGQNRRWTYCPWRSPNLAYGICDKIRNLLFNTLKICNTYKYLLFSFSKNPEKSLLLCFSIFLTIFPKSLQQINIFFYKFEEDNWISSQTSLGKLSPLLSLMYFWRI